MPLTHYILALIVVLAWGLNFLFVSYSLMEVPPLLLCALRFFLSSLPLIGIIKPPKAPFRYVALYGLLMFALQFGFIFTGMTSGITAGIAGIILQVQVFFTMIFAHVFLGETILKHQRVGATIAFSGIAMVAFHVDAHVSVLGFILILLAAAVAGVGNLINKKLKTVNMFSLVVWGCLVASVPMLFLSLAIEGTSGLTSAYHQLTWVGGLSLLYTVVFSTWLGYVGWGWLIVRHPVSTIAPFTMLIPIVALLSSVYFLNEPLTYWKIGTCVLVLSGLYINLFGARFFIPALNAPSPSVK